MYKFIHWWILYEFVQILRTIKATKMAWHFRKFLKPLRKCKTAIDFMVMTSCKRPPYCNNEKKSKTAAGLYVTSGYIRLSQFSAVLVESSHQFLCDSTSNRQWDTISFWNGWAIILSFRNNVSCVCEWVCGRESDQTLKPI